MRDALQEAEALEAKKAAKRRAEEERISKLSAAEQKKVRCHRLARENGSFIGTHSRLSNGSASVRSESRRAKSLNDYILFIPVNILWVKSMCPLSVWEIAYLWHPPIRWTPPCSGYSHCLLGPWPWRPREGQMLPTLPPNS